MTSVRRCPLLRGSTAYILYPTVGRCTYRNTRLLIVRTLVPFYIDLPHPHMSVDVFRASLPTAPGYRNSSRTFYPTFVESFFACYYRQRLASRNSSRTGPVAFKAPTEVSTPSGLQIAENPLEGGISLGSQ